MSKKDILFNIFEAKEDNELLAYWTLYCTLDNKKDSIIYLARAFNALWNETSQIDLTEYNPDHEYFTINEEGNPVSFPEEEVRDHIEIWSMVDFVVDNQLSSWFKPEELSPLREEFGKFLKKHIGNEGTINTDGVTNDELVVLDWYDLINRCYTPEGKER